MSVGQAAYNMPQKDAQLLYTMEFASCSCPRVRCHAIINSGQEHDFFAVDVICHVRRKSVSRSEVGQ